MKRRITLILTFVFLAVLLSLTTLLSVGAETKAVTPTVSVDKFNLVFSDNVYLKYAVKFDGVEDTEITADNVGMLYFDEPQDDYTSGVEKYSSGVVGYTTISGVKYYTFEYRNLTAKQMTDYIYSVAYVELDGVRYYSEPVKYSVLDYVYIKHGLTGEASTNENLKSMLSSMLIYGGDAQKYFGYKTSRIASSTFYQIKVEGGTLEDGFLSGLYHNGETATLTAPETNGDQMFYGWKNSDGELVSKENPATITKFLKHDTYTAIYGEANENSKYIYFGEYPQSIKDDNVTIDLNTQDSRGYYLGSDGFYYAAVVSSGSGYKFSNDTVASSGTIHYFKVEPIKWRILSLDDESAIILCDSIIEHMEYQSDEGNPNNWPYITANGAPDGTHINNYKYSDVRRWLNSDFYNKAFTSFEKESILTTNVDNSAATTDNSSNKYACENTEDKVFLLSYQDVTNGAYGFTTDDYPDKARDMKTSDYSRALGASGFMSTDLTNYGIGSPHYYMREYVCQIRYSLDDSTDDFSAEEGYYSSGIVPAMRVSIDAISIHTPSEAVIDNEVPATCTIPGSYDNVIYCADCGEELSRETVVLSALGHNYVDDICTRCDEERVYPIVAYDKDGNVVKKWETTHIEDGTLDYLSDGSKIVLNADVTAGSIHTYRDYSLTIDLNGHKLTFTNSTNMQLGYSMSGSWYERVITFTSSSGRGVIDATKRTGNAFQARPGSIVLFENLDITFGGNGFNDGGAKSITFRNCNVNGNSGRYIANTDGLGSHTEGVERIYTFDSTTVNGIGIFYNSLNMIDVISVNLLNGSVIDNTSKIVTIVPSLRSEVLGVSGVRTVTFNIESGVRFKSSDLDYISYSVTTGGNTYTTNNAVINYSYFSDNSSDGFGEEFSEDNVCFADYPEGGVIVTEDKPPHTHTPADAAEENRVDATCTAPGSYESVVYCTECGVELSRESVKIPTIDHSFTDNVCTVCGCADYSQGLEYLVIDDTTCKVSGLGTCTDTDIVIPSTAPDGRAVVEIYRAFEGKTEITGITIPDSVKAISDYAFYGCTGLTNLTIGSGVTSIGNYTFENCIGLVSINVDENNTAYKSIDGNLYTKDGKTLLQYAIGKEDTSFIIPDTVTSIGDWAFYNCTGLTNVVIPDSVTSIGGRAFEYCTGLTSVEMGNGVTSIGASAFWECTQLTSIIIPDSVTSIGSDAFSGCTALTSVTIGSGVTSMGDYAFADCFRLVEVINKSSLEITVGSSENGDIAVYAKIVHTGDTLIKNVDDYLFITLDEVNYLVSYVGDDTELMLPEDYNGESYVINYLAFYRCTGLTSVTIPDGFTSIIDLAFAECTELTSVTIGNGIESVGEYAFYGCSSLTDVYYIGTEEEWNAIIIGGNNDPLTNATKHYNHTPDN